MTRNNSVQKAAIINSMTDRIKKPRLRERTDRSWFSRLVRHPARKTRAAVRSVTLNLANKFRQCTFSVAEHYDLFSDLIILRQAWWRRSYDVIQHRPHQTDRETAAGKAQRYHTDLKLIYMLPIMPYTTSRQFRVDGHLKSVRNNRRHLYKTATPTR